MDMLRRLIIIIIVDVVLLVEIQSDYTQYH